MATLPDDLAVLRVFEDLALAAGNCIMAVLREGCTAEAKADSSPVTKADHDAEDIIIAGLRAEFPSVAVVAEEEIAAGKTPDVGDAFFLVDPLDGTREFVRGGDDFTVNIALVRGGIPVVGVVCAPARNVLYAGSAGKAEVVTTDNHHRALARRRIMTRTVGSPVKIVASRSHCTPETEDFIMRFESADRVSVGSSLKFCLLASGEADLYPRFGRTMQWDTAAGDAILRAAGGITRTLDGEPLRYGSHTVLDDEAFANPHFIAEGKCLP